MLQQIEHGALQIAAQYRTVGRLVRGIVDGELHRYHHLGDASTQTDNLIYDPSLKPYESDGRPQRHARRPMGLHGAVARPPTTRGSALWPRPAGRYGASTTLWRPTVSRSRRRRTPRSGPAPRRRRRRPASGFAGFGQFAELTAVMQLMTATKEPPYADRFDELVWPALDRNAGMTLQVAARAIPVMDPAYATKLRPYVEKYRTELDAVLKRTRTASR